MGSSDSPGADGPVARRAGAGRLVRLWWLLRCTHLEASVAVTAFATVLALAAGRGAAALLVGGAVLAGQFSIGWANDWVDAARDRATGRADKPVARGDVTVGTVRTAALAALACCVVLSLANGLVAGAVHLLAVAFGWAYDLRLKATVASVVPYAAAFGLLPVFVWLGGPAGAPPAWVPAAGALLGAGAHFVNVLPDLADDAATGVRGLPQRLGATGSLAAAAVLLGTAAVVVGVAAGAAATGAAAVAVRVAAGVSLAVVAAVVVTGARRSRAAFLLAIAAAAAVVVTVVIGGGAV